MLRGLAVWLLAVLAIAVSPVNAQKVDRLEAGRRLLRQQKFAEAEAEFTAVLKAAKSWDTKTARSAVDGGVACALQQKKWDAALELVERFRRGKNEPVKPADDFVRLMDLGGPLWTRVRGKPNEVAKLTRARLVRIERCRGLLRRIAEESGRAPAKFRTRLEKSRIVGNLTIIRNLDLNSPGEGGVGGTPLPDNRWWWRGIPAADRQFLAGDKPYAVTPGVPVDANGRPLFLTAPKRYVDARCAGEKVLFLLQEVGTLDTTPNRDSAALAIILRFAYVDRLYGPANDPQWDGRYDDGQDAFGNGLTPKPIAMRIKPFRQLADDEARVAIHGRTTLLKLPATHRPLALLRRVENEFPKSRLVPEAIFHRGLYFQRRRQFDKALLEFRRLAARYPKDRRGKAAKRQIETIDGGDVELKSTGTVPLGEKPKMTFTCRATAEVRFAARQFDLVGFFKERMKGEYNRAFPEFVWPDLDFTVIGGRSAGFFSVEDQAALWKKFVGKPAASWTVKVPKSLWPADHDTIAPLTKPGVYLIEATMPGTKVVARTLVIVTGVALVTQHVRNTTFAWVVDSRTGRPLAKQRVHLYRPTRKSAPQPPWTHEVFVTGPDGIARLKGRRWRDIVMFVDDAKRGLAFNRSGLRQYDGWDYLRSEYRHAAWLVTDRPVYRPGDTVHFRVWSRRVKEREFQLFNPPGRITIQVGDPRGKPYRQVQLTRDRHGTASGSFRISPESQLGEYALWLAGGDSEQICNNVSFRVEEYRKPEFDVTVLPQAKHEPGKPLKARVQARYYFGRPVARGTVRYTVFRSAWLPPAPRHQFDWMYGNGFGLPGAPLAAQFFDAFHPNYFNAFEFSERDVNTWYSDIIEGAPQEIAKGTAVLDRDGIAEVTVKTSNERPESISAADWEAFGSYTYRIVAEVRDDSRRTVKGSGEVLAQPRPYTVHVEPDRNWYDAGATATVRVTTRVPGGAATAAGGEFALFRLSQTGNDLTLRETLVTRWNIATNAAGEAVHRVPLREAGRYRIAFLAADARKRSARGWYDIWVHKSGATLANSSVKTLQLIPDRRTYRAGDAARLLVLKPEADTRLMLTSTAGSDYRFDDVVGRSGVVAFRIDRRHVPNVVIQAAYVKDGRSRHAKCELFVPPVDRMLRVKLTPDRGTYKPGGKARIDVSVTDANGKPVSGDLTLTAYDQALTYIHADDIVRPRWLFRNLLQRADELHSEGSLLRELFSSDKRMHPPEFEEPQIDPVWLNDGKPNGGRIVPYEQTLSLIIRQTQRVIPGTGAYWRPIGVGAGFGGGGVGGGVGGGGFFGAPGAKVSVVHEEVPASRSKRRIVPATIRSNFADRPLWFPTVKLDAQGRGTVEMTLPQSLTAWRMRAFVITPRTLVGDALVEVTTAKDLLVRLQTPRFVVEGDRVVLSANVHNDLKREKSVTAELTVPAALFAPDAAAKTKGTIDSKGLLHLTATARVKARGVHRFDWPLRVRTAMGTATVTVKALTDEESDAMQLPLQVVPRGFNERFARSGSMRSGAESVTFSLAKDVDPARTSLEITLAPSAAAAMLDAIPYLAQYPYGCVEQTMSRFYPLALARQALKQLGTDFEALSRRHRGKRGAFSGPSPVFDTKQTQEMTDAGLQRLYRFQHADGGWGWWENDASTPYMTAYVLLGLHAARQAGVAVRESVVENGRQYLLGHFGDGGKVGTDFDSLHTLALAAYVITGNRGQQDKAAQGAASKWLAVLGKSQDRLNAYGKTLLAISLHHVSRKHDAKKLLAAVLKTALRDDKKQTSWVPVSAGYRWMNSETETNAFVLRAMLLIDPEHPRVPEFANWLAANRRGRHWDSTRSTALAISALAAHAKTVGKTAAAAKVDVHLDGAKRTTIRVTWDDVLAGRNRVVISGKDLKPGAHTITLTGDGRTPVYYAVTADSFRKPKQIPPESRGLAVERRYFRVHPDTGKPVPLKTGEPLKVGDVIEVELKITAAADYEFLAFEDPKPAGCEPVQVRSGSVWGDGFWGNVELRHRKVVFFAAWLPKGTQTVRFRLRAETPGEFAVLPPTGFAMYNPDVRARGRESRLRIAD